MIARIAGAWLVAVLLLVGCTAAAAHLLPGTRAA